MAAVARIGVIGGSGVYSMKEARVIREIKVDTPFGQPSDNLILVDLHGVEVVFLPRHGRGHVYTPTEVNYRANIYAMKSLGVQWIIGVSAVGSLQEEIVPGHVVLVDQFIDRTSKRQATFFGDGIVAHVSFAHPVCNVLHSILKESCAELGVKCHPQGTYVNMEGPAFSTVSESHLYRSWGAAVIGMTALTEAKLAREAEISYAVLAMATDYDCWRADHDAVTVDQVVAVLNANASVAQNLVRTSIARIAAYTGPAPSVRASLQYAVMTAPNKIPAAALARLQPIVGRLYDTPDSNQGLAVSLGVFAAASAALVLWARRQ